MPENKKLPLSAGSRNAVQATICSELVTFFLVFSFAASSGVLEQLLQALRLIGYGNIICFIFSSIFFAYVLGRQAGIVVHKKEHGRFYIGYKAGLLVTVYSTLLTSLLAFSVTLINTGLPADWFLLYIAKPLAWMICLSSFPILIAGSWYSFTMTRSTGE